MTAPPAPGHASATDRIGTARNREPRQRWAELQDALHAEWTKLRTTPAAASLAVATLVLTAGLSAVVVSAAQYHPGSEQDLAKTSLTGIDLGQAVIAVLAVYVIGNEYGTRMIATTLAAIPRRVTMLTAKATVVAGVGLTAGSAAVLTSLVAARLLLPANGFTVAHGYDLVSLGDSSMLRAAAGSVLYLTLIALLSLGIATVLRDSATAIGLVLALLFLFPIIASAINDPTWQRHLRQISPMDAGQAIQATINLNLLPIGPWAGLGVLAGWAAGAMLAAAASLRFRDA